MSFAMYTGGVVFTGHIGSHTASSTVEETKHNEIGVDSGKERAAFERLKEREEDDAEDGTVSGPVSFFDMKDFPIAGPIRRIGFRKGSNVGGAEVFAWRDFEEAQTNELQEMLKHVEGMTLPEFQALGHPLDFKKNSPMSFLSLQIMDRTNKAEQDQMAALFTSPHE